jgi:hypothetical protein
MLIVIANYLGRFRDELAVNMAFQVGLVASASRDALNDWSKSVGDVVGHLGFSELNAKEALHLRSLTIHLCDLVPELWSACGRGIAAMEAAATI